MGEPEDTSGLKHQYVDSTVTNGKTYYYAVVSFDHGDDSLKLPPSESQAIIQRDAVTQAFKFDANTVVAVPNAEAKGLVSSKELLEKGLTLTHTKGNSTAKLEFKVLNNLATINGSYNISFVKTKIGTDSVIAYSILRRTPVVETVIGNENLFINLTNKNIVLKSLRVFNGADTMASQISPAVIIVDSANGRFRANAAGILLKEKNYTVAYQYYPVVNSGFNKSEDSNPVFDGIRVFATDDTLQYDNARSLFVPTQSSKITSQVAKATAGTEKRMPIDIRFTFVSGTNDTANGMYITPGDTIGSSNGVNGKRVVLPFKITNGTDTTILRAFAATNTPSATPVKWNFGTQIIILPPPYNVSMMGITLSRMDTTVSISAGTVFTARMRKPFTVADEYEFTSKAVVYDAKLADAQLENVIAVPNPYVITSRFEQPSDRPELRGDRVIQFRHLPRECTIRIYTITGELVQTLRKNDNTNYINWDVLSSESARIGYGLYVYHVETPTGATKIGRIGIIK